MSELKCCPICGKEIDIETDLYIPERDWKPTFYDPDSGGDPINIHCECGLEFSTGTYDWNEFIKAWNRRKPMSNIVEKLEERERYLEKAMKESHENGHRFSEEKAMNERVAIRYAINIVKQEINNGLE